jgi:hypothetical protein
MDKKTDMITFRTEVELPGVKKQLSYRRNALMIGSCFTENIGNYLQNHLFPVMTNPCGILYNPASIANCINFLVSEKQLSKTDLFYAHDSWNNFHFHSRFSNSDPDSALNEMNRSMQRASDQLKSASHLFITFGTSWVYREKESQEIVGNCHKLPANRFSHERLKVEEMTHQWIGLLKQLLIIHPEISIVLTVSPIRHFKDGSYENQVSKSALFLLIDHLIEHFGSKVITYFPSYDLVMDELRDYRFYAADMLHLNDVATAFVQEKFNSAFLDSESLEIISRVDKLLKTIMHKPFHTNSSAYQALLTRMENEALEMATNYPFVHFENLITEIIQKKRL